MKIAYKGFDKDLKCRGEQFTLGEVYSKNVDLKNPKLCTADGYHYCNELKHVFEHYPNRQGNRFCEIQILGAYTDDITGNKSTTTSFRILREISLWELRSLELTAATSAMEKNLNLETVAEIQQRYPMFHVGGSVGLFLHGVRLQRWTKGTSSRSDLDMVSPYFVLVEDPEGQDGVVDHLDGKASGNDFDETFLYDGVKVDYKIDPKQRYEIIEYRGTKYKVSPLLTILEAKMRYALNGQHKHKNDITEMIKAGFISDSNTVSTNDLLF